MSLFWQELKKIWRPGILVGIVLLGLIYYYMFPSFYIEHFSKNIHCSLVVNTNFSPIRQTAISVSTLFPNRPDQQTDRKS